MLQIVCQHSRGKMRRCTLHQVWSLISQQSCYYSMWHNPPFLFLSFFYLNILLIGSTLKCNAEGEISQLFDIFVKEEFSLLDKYCYQPEKSYFWGGIKRKKKLPRERPLTDLACDDCQDKRRKMQLQYFNINSPKFNARLDTYWPSIYVLLKICPSLLMGNIRII